MSDIDRHKNRPKLTRQKDRITEGRIDKDRRTERQNDRRVERQRQTKTERQRETYFQM
jgi:hypothetical protein